MSAATAGSWAKLHAAIAKACKARGDSQDHHRACIEDIKTEERPDLAGWIALFESIAEAHKTQPTHREAAA